MVKKSVKQHVNDMVRWYYGIKSTRDTMERSFQDAKFDFNTCMDKYYNKLINEDDKLEVQVNDIKNIDRIFVKKITPSVVEWDIEKLKSILSKKDRRLVIHKNYQVTDWKGLFGLLKDNVVDFKEFLKYVDFTEEVDYKQLDKLIDMGIIDEADVKKCSSVVFKNSYYKLTEK